MVGDLDDVAELLAPARGGRASSPAAVLEAVPPLPLLLVMVLGAAAHRAGGRVRVRVRVATALDAVAVAAAATASGLLLHALVEGPLGAQDGVLDGVSRGRVPVCLRRVAAVASDGVAEAVAVAVVGQLCAGPRLHHSAAAAVALEDSRGLRQPNLLRELQRVSAGLGGCPGSQSGGHLPWKETGDERKAVR
jgi:hypothetical protein